MELKKGTKKNPIKVLVWSELTEPEDVYPERINGAICDYLNKCYGIVALKTDINGEEQGLPEKFLSETDVLIWFGHIKHEEIKDEKVEEVLKHIKERGMGFIALHSSLSSKIFKRLMGTSCKISGWKEDGKPAFIKVINPFHPIAYNVNDFVIPNTEWYKEPIDLPQPESIIFVGLYQDGKEITRDGMLWKIGKGKVFYFRPGHEKYPIFYMREVLKIIENAVRFLSSE
jgi:trehalose utilization protein